MATAARLEPGGTRARDPVCQLLIKLMKLKWREVAGFCYLVQKEQPEGWLPSAWLFAFLRLVPPRSEDEMPVDPQLHEAVCEDAFTRCPEFNRPLSELCGFAKQVVQYLVLK